MTTVWIQYKGWKISRDFSLLRDYVATKTTVVQSEGLEISTHEARTVKLYAKTPEILHAEIDRRELDSAS